MTAGESEIDVDAYRPWRFGDAYRDAEVVGSTATFDLRPRTPEEQSAWMAEHQGTYPVVVAVDDGGTVLGFGSLSTYRDRPSYATTVENSVYVDAAHRGGGGRRSSWGTKPPASLPGSGRRCRAGWPATASPRRAPCRPPSGARPARSR